MSRKDKPRNETTPLEKWFDRLRIKHTNHMDKRGNYTLQPKR